MPPAKSKKAAKPAKAAKKAAPKAPKPAAKAKGRSSAPAPKAKAAVAKPAAPTHGGNVHAHCAASDPFGDPCQNLPRRPSKYCVIHSYLER